ncbi:MAG: regulatory protein RecX [Nocardioides sp.]|uniref:regulatory protein RecX n=1 Tax=Nocardioides sp. TaxID=35761 RepID=UPI0039E64D1A
MTSKAARPVAGRPWEGDVAAGVAAWAGHDLAAEGRAAPERGRSSAAPADPMADGPDADPEAVARKILLDQLTGQARSRAELRTKLDRRGVPEEISEQLLDRFTEVGLIDDEAFARAWVESRQASRGLAPRALAQELRRKGVSDEVAREAVAEVDQEAQEAAARALVRRRLRSLQRVDATTATRRLVGMLARKGYSSGLALAVVRSELAQSADEDDLLT